MNKKEQILNDLRDLVLRTEAYNEENKSDIEIRLIVMALRTTSVGREVSRELHLKKKEEYQAQKGKTREERRAEYEGEPLPEEKHEEPEDLSIEEEINKHEDKISEELEKMTLKELRALAANEGIKNSSKMNKADVIHALTEF